MHRAAQQSMLQVPTAACMQTTFIESTRGDRHSPPLFLVHWINASIAACVGCRAAAVVQPAAAGSTGHTMLRSARQHVPGSAAAMPSRPGSAVHFRSTMEHRDGHSAVARRCRGVDAFAAARERRRPRHRAAPAVAAAIAGATVTYYAAWMLSTCGTVYECIAQAATLVHFHAC
jgi:hypothetical protein